MAISSIIFRLIISIMIIKLILDYKKLGYILCLILGYGVGLLNKVAFIVRFETIPKPVSLFILDSLLVIAFIISSHWALILSKNIKK
tara:strand:+ start:219 stop:479 length:261 start_codon:yes stop_codon:yes gene_type:complete